ncbi:MarR family transcriptional regulator, 2-MHQ and catechol-resistance regulon repressor [Gracilibacillus ureilyticus]|uniref:MarR family transcriptional regulator, 2-MHQ and catechol-resistance regulon repressor n=1 Tax=Gracilibacillus ureilyticus TaxID=531814 RepID=A0A1H9TA92_9BACI|nr:MarR family transcriptional regulator [Gracilibacillus ureilyticus]SER94048.1 MarR family transcriptional regulator, 2-MHQ and catechol-resistance regulon repressor [Gracilibacillus ureilyticus]
MDQKLQYAEKDLKLFRIWLKATKTLYDNVTKDITSHGLTIENFMTLELLYNKGPQYIQVISEKLMIPSGSITYVVNKLEKKELAMREINNENKRYCKVVLTEKGEALFNEIFPKHVGMIVKNLEVLDNEQKEQLTTLLKTVGLAAKELS